MKPKDILKIVPFKSVKCIARKPTDLEVQLHQAEISRRGLVGLIPPFCVTYKRRTPK